MRKLHILSGSLLALAISAHGQVSNPSIIPVSSDPTGVACTGGLPNEQYQGTMFTCKGGVWTASGGGSVTVTISTSGPVTVSATGFYFNNAAGALTYNLPTIASGDEGKQYCFRNYTTKTGAITLQSPASTFIDVSGTNGSSAGTLVSTGALGDSACVVAASTTQYVAYPWSGSWTNN